MELRNVQKTGRHSFIVTLPKDWINKHQIQQKQPVFIETMKNGTLLIHPQVDQSSDMIEHPIEINQEQTPEEIFRTLLGIYLSGITSFHIYCKGQFQEETLDTIYQFEENFEGLEIREESLNSIHFECSEALHISTLRRLFYRIVETLEYMFSDNIEMLKSEKMINLDKITERDQIINQTFWKISHLFNQFLNKPYLSPFSLSKFNKMFTIYLHLKKIGENLVEFANSLAIFDISILEMTNTHEITKLLEKNKHFLEIITDDIKDKNQDNIHSIFSNTQCVIDRCKFLTQKCSKGGESLLISLRFLDLISRISINIQNLCEIASNFSLS